MASRPTSRREFFKVLVGTVAAASLPSAAAIEPFVALEPISVLPAVDWFHRAVRYDLSWNCWDVYGVARVGDVAWELCVRYVDEPGPAELEKFNETFKDALARRLFRG